MEVVQFYGKIYGRENSQLYVFEETWDSFRPISKVVWNGKKFQVNDSEYKSDLFSPVYGYGSTELKVRCRDLTATTELENAIEVTDPIVFWKWCGTPTEWFRDRQCVVNKECSDKNWRKFVSYTNSKPRTLRHGPAGRVTKRLIAKRMKV